MATPTDELEEFADTLKLDRLIQIYVGDEGAPGGDKPFLIQQSISCGVSEYFVKAIKNERLGAGQTGVLKFPTDDPEIWKIMLYWIMIGYLPEKVTSVADDDDISVMIRSWVQGDKYLIPEFQNYVMLELLRAGDLRPWDNLEVIVEAFQATLPESRLRCMAAEQLISGVYVRRFFKENKLDALDGIPWSSEDDDGCTSGVPRNTRGEYG